MDRFEEASTSLLARAQNWQSVRAFPAIASAVVAKNIKHLMQDNREPQFILDWLNAQTGSFISEEIDRIEEAKRREFAAPTVAEVEAEIQRLLALDGARRAYLILPDA